MTTENFISLGVGFLIGLLVLWLRSDEMLDERRLENAERRVEELASEVIKFVERNERLREALEKRIERLKEAEARLVELEKEKG
jgi:hypothetical protein